MKVSESNPPAELSEPSPSENGVETGMHLLVMIPALNEAASIGGVIDRVPTSIAGVSSIQVLVIDDGSTDDTAEIASQHGAAVVQHGKNRGVGAAIQTGLSEAVRRGADVAVNIDGDGQFAPEDIVQVVEPILRGDADMASASRFKDPELVPEMPKVKLFGNRGMSWMISSLVGQRFYDVSCGFRAYSREALLRLVLTGRFTYTQEMFLVLSFRGLRVVEIPIRVRGVREHGKSRVASNIPKYAFKTSQIIFGCFRDYRPGLFFGAICAVLGVIGLLFGAFFVAHRVIAGSFSPHVWAGFTAAYLLGASLILFVFGQLAAMMDRIRVLQEEQVYLLRRDLVQGRQHPNQRPE